MNDELISVIIPAYKAELYIERCIRSVLDNTYKNLEVLIVDDGSPDRTGDICDNLAKQDPRIKVLHQKNQGTAAARNAALDIAKGSYIAFADNDDFVHRRFYDKMLDVLHQTDADIVVCELTRDMEVTAFEKQCVDDVEGALVDKAAFIKDTYCSNWTRNTPPWNKLYKRQLFDTVRFPLGKGYEDAYTTWRLIWQARSIAWVNMPLYYWYQNGESYSSKKSNPKKLFFREEAIREQAQFYTNQEKNGCWEDVAHKAQYFYLDQLKLMYWQLMHDYREDADAQWCLKKMKKLYRRQFRKYQFLCQSKEEKLGHFELIHPFVGGVIRSRFF